MRIWGPALAVLVLIVTGPAQALATPVAPQLRGESIFLPNLDDDTRRCRVDPAEMAGVGAAIDRKLAACNDAADEVVNGGRDEADLTHLRLRGGAAVKISVDRPDKARVFVRRDGRFQPLSPGDELRSGAEVAIEGRDILRDTALWDGRVRLTAESGSRRSVKEMRVAPLLLQHDLMRATTVFANTPGTGPGWAGLPLPEGHPGDGTEFRKTLTRATRSAGVPTQFVAGPESWWKDVWLQDNFEPAVASMPSRHGVQTMRVMIRSANQWDLGEPTPRPSGRVLFRDFRGPDVAVVQEYGDAAPADPWIDQRNATGNFEMLPPYAGNPRGRLYYGSGERKPNPAFVKLFEAQGEAPPVVLDTSWLMVGHVDEIFHAVPARNERGWTLMVTDPRLGESLLREAQARGAGSARFFERSAHPVKPSVDELLGNPKTLAENETAARHIDDQVAIMLRETGLRADELVRVPVLFGESTRAPGMAPLAPAVINGLSLTPGRYAAPDPHGPLVDGRDLFKTATAAALSSTGVHVDWVEDVFWAYLGGGDVHCTTNAWRDTHSVERWW